MKKTLFYLFVLFLPVCGLAQRTWDTIPNLPDHYNQLLAKFKKERVVKGKVLFLGNSITEGGNWKKLLKDSSIINQGISGDITFGIINRIPEVVRQQPAKVFLLIGINDISKNIPDEVIMENIFSIAVEIKRRLPKTTIYVQSILPTNNAVPNFPTQYDKNDHVATINGQLQKYGARLKYTYIDLASGFSDGEGRLIAKYSTDGLHLNAAGYAHWVEILKSLKTF